MNDETESRVVFLETHQIDAAHAVMWEQVAKERAERIEALERALRWIRDNPDAHWTSVVEVANNAITGEKP